MGNDPGNGCLQERRAKSDDLPVGKQIEEEGADILKTFRATEVEQ